MASAWACAFTMALCALHFARPRWPIRHALCWFNFYFVLICLPTCDAMQTLTQSLDPRRLSMLKAMGVELWWAKAPKAATASSAVAVSPSVVPQPLVESALVAAQSPQQEAVVERSSVAPMPRPAGAAQQPPAAPTLVHAAAEPAAKRAIEPSSAAPTAAANMPAVVFSSPNQWQSLQGQEQELPVAKANASVDQASGLLLLVDDLQALGDAQAAGMQLLENMVRAMGLAQSSTLWLSWAKRTPQEVNADAVAKQQGAAVSAQQLVADASPRAVLVMGRDAAQHWLDSNEPLGVLRQANHQAHGVPVVVTYSPAYLLRATHAKRQAWADLQRVMAMLAPTASA